MKIVLLGDCKPGHIFQQEDASVPTEAEFEFFCVKALSCMWPRHLCVRFEADFEYDGRICQPDLALVAKDFSHWFVIEVELVAHSFELHVLPQVKAFRYGDIRVEQASRVLAERLGVDLGQARTLVTHIPRAVAVVVNRYQADWERVLGSHDIQFVAVSTYRATSGETAIEVEGRLAALKEVVGWATYSVTDRSLRLPNSVALPSVARLQIEDPYGAVSWWNVSRDSGVVWLTKETGVLDLLHDQIVQLVRTIDGRLSMRVPT